MSARNEVASPPEQESVSDDTLIHRPSAPASEEPAPQPVASQVSRGTAHGYAVWLMMQMQAYRYGILICAICLFLPWLLRWAAFFPRNISATESSDRIEIYEYWGHYTLDNPPEDMKPIVLRVPEDFRYGLSKGAARNWGVNILTYYPTFTSVEAPENARYGLRCAGICNGRILILVEYRQHSIGTAPYYSPNMGDFIVRSTTKWHLTPPYAPNFQVQALKSHYDFDEGYQQTVTSPNNGPTEQLKDKQVIERYFFRKLPDNTHYMMAATCRQVFQERSICILHFSLSCDPEIYISVHGLDESFLMEADDIRVKVDNFISKMVVNPRCGQ